MIGTEIGALGAFVIRILLPGEVASPVRIFAAI